MEHEMKGKSYDSLQSQLLHIEKKSTKLHHHVCSIMTCRTLEFPCRSHFKLAPAFEGCTLHHQLVSQGAPCMDWKRGGVILSYHIRLWAINIKLSLNLRCYIALQLKEFGA
jgi:hypothetical protein